MTQTDFGGSLEDAVYKHREEGYYLKILALNIEPGKCVAIKLSQEAKVLHMPELYELNFFKSKKFKREEIDPFLIDVPESEIPEATRSFRDFRFNWIKKLVQKVPDIYYPRRRSQMIEEALNERKKKQELENNLKTETKTLTEKGVKKRDESTRGRTQIFELLKLHWVHGKNGLIPKYFNSGGKGQRKPASKSKRGRARKTASSKETNITQFHIDKIMAGFEKHYVKNKASDLFDAYNMTLATEYDNLKKIPSPGQFKYWTDQLADHERVRKFREGPIVFEKDIDPLTGGARDIFIYGPGSEAAIDSTLDNVQVLSIKTPGNYGGRLTVYLLVDIFSGYIMGFYVSPENPSYLTACSVLMNCTEDKRALCEKLEIPYKPEEWLCPFLPGRLLADNAELLSKMSNSIVDTLKIDISNTPSWRADLKAIVERAIKSLQEKMASLIDKGLVTKDYGTRIGKDSRKEATLNVYDVLKIIVPEILHYNLTTWLEEYPLTPEMIRDDVDPIPAELLKWGRRQGLGNLKSFPQETLRRNLLPTKKAALDKDGIKFLGLDFVPAEKEGVKLRRRLYFKGIKSVTVSYNRSIFKECFIYHDRKFYPLRPRHAGISFDSFFERIEVQKHYAEKEAVHNEKKLEADVRRIKNGLKVVSNAKSKRIKNAKLKDSKATKKRDVEAYLQTESPMRPPQHRIPKPLKSNTVISVVPDLTAQIKKLRK